MQIVGIVIPFPLIVEMGWLATLLSIAFIAFGILWYSVYGRDHVRREGAIYHVFERLGQQRNQGLERELRQILKEKGVRDADPFERLIASSDVLDYEGGVPFSELVDRASRALSEQLGVPAARLAEGLLEGAGTGLTPMSQGVVLPHLHLDSIPGPRMVLARVRGGIEIDTGEPDVPPADDEPIQAAFFLASPKADRSRHLRTLAQIAGRVDDGSFLLELREAEDDLELREVMLRDEHMLVVEVLPEGASSVLDGMTIQEMALPKSTHLAIIRRRGQLVVPHDDTVVETGDRLTILGSPRDVTSSTCGTATTCTRQSCHAGGRAGGKGERNETMGRDQRLLLQGVEGKLLPRRAAFQPDAGVLLPAAEQRRDQQHLLPSAAGRDAGEVGVTGA